MKTARQIKDENGGYLTYDAIVEEFGHVEVKKDDDDYQGDTRVLLRSKGRPGEGAYGYLCFGWGSCSGCDALQGCYGSDTEEQQLMDELYQSIVWFASARDAYDWFMTHDWAGDYSRDITFILECAKRLSVEPAREGGAE